MANSEMIRESALVWIRNNTTFDTAIDPLPANVELFVEKFAEVMRLRPGVASESAQGLSQSFNVSEASAMLKQYARELIGAEYMLSDVKVFPAVDRWVY